MRRVPVAALRLLLLLTAAPVVSAHAAAPSRGGADADWPCVQRFVPRVSAAALWPAPLPEGEWRAVPEVAALVGRIAPRTTTEAEGVAAIEAFAAPLDAAARRRLLPLAFSGALEETNRQRTGLMDQIRRFARRQRDLTEVVQSIEAEQRALPDTAATAERRAELEQRRFFTTKAFEDAERTLRYACEAPVRLEGRLGAYARALAAALPAD